MQNEGIRQRLRRVWNEQCHEDQLFKIHIYWVPKSNLVDHLHVILKSTSARTQMLANLIGCLRGCGEAGPKAPRGGPNALAVSPVS